MADRKTDAERAAELGMTLDQFQALVGFDPLDAHPEYTDATYKIDKINLGDTTFQRNRDVDRKQPMQVEHYWKKHPGADEQEEALYYGYHMHTKDDV
jgi:hypothetical protein